MANVFDQFDSAPAQNANPFDQFDVTPAAGAGPPNASFGRTGQSLDQQIVPPGQTVGGSLMPAVVGIERAINEGIPGSARIIAGAKSLPLVGNGQGYADNLAQEQAARTQQDQKYPLSTAFGRGVGGVMTAAALPGAGAAESGLAPALEAGARTGAAYGGAQGVSDQPDLSNIIGDIVGGLTGAVKGAAIGGGFSAAGYGAGKAAGALADRFAPSGEPIADNWAATRALLQAYQRDTAAPPLEPVPPLGPKGMVLDEGPAMLRLAQAVGTKGAGAPAMTNELTSRMKGVDADIAKSLPGIIGPDQSAQGAALGLRAQKAEEGTALPGIFEGSGPVDILPVVQTIDSLLSKTATGTPEASALIKARSMLTESAPEGSETATQPVSDSAKLQSAKMALDNLIKFGDPTIGVTPGALAAKTGSLKTVAGGVNTSLRDQAPGYADTMDALSSLNRQMEALKYGRDLLGGGNNAVNPADSAAHIGALPDEEAGAVRTGLNSKIYQDIGTGSNSRASLNRILPPNDNPNPESPNLAKWNTAKLGQVFGPEEIKALSDLQGRSNQFARSYNSVVANSPTAHRTAAVQELNGPNLVDTAHQLATPYGRARFVAGNVASKMFNTFGGVDARNIALAKALTAQGPAKEAISDAFLRLMIDKAARPVINKQIGANAAPIATGMGLGMFDR